MSEDDEKVPGIPEGEAALQHSRERAMHGLEVLSNPAFDDVKDLDPQDWLGVDDGDPIGSVQVGNSRLRIAAITEAETNLLMKRNRRPDPSRPQQEPRLDAARFRLDFICLSLNKANPSKPPVTPNQLESKKTGILTRIQEAIMELSGMETRERSASSSFFA